MWLDDPEVNPPAGHVNELMAGFPPCPASQVTLANWQDAPNQRWAFQHMREVIPTHPIPAGPNAAALPAARRQMGNPSLIRLDGTKAGVDDVLADTFTDAVMVLHDGMVVAERYYAGMHTGSRHLLMSVSKSIVGCVAGVLVEQGRLDPEAQVTGYVPEVGESGYGGATVRNLLDMRTGVAFRETYTAPDSEVRVMERSMGWLPALPDDPSGMYAYLATLKMDTAHGGDFVYRSADTDMLGWVCERAAGIRMADLISTLVWQPLGAEYDAEITCDAVGSAVHDGGISATLRDLARFGQLLLDDGAVRERQVVPRTWLASARTPSADVREAFARSDNEPVLPGGWYRNQFWFVPGRNGHVLVCLGIHGQMVYVEPSSRTVAVKLSSWPDAQNTAHLVDTLRAFGAISADLTNRMGEVHRR
jgi:CubicO group peptidase (beta-lactamase class C family)